MKRWIRPIAFGLFFLVAIIVTLPVALAPGSRVVGGEETDVWTHLWGYWRTEQDVLVNGQFPYHLEYINYPHGGDLYHIDLLNSILYYPLKLLFGPIAGFNLLVWLQTALAGFAAYLLARRFTKREGPAFLAGLAFAFCPFALAFPLASGVTERLNLGWVVLFFYFFLKTVDEGRAKNFILTGLMLLLAALGCWRYGMFSYLIAFFFSVYLLAIPAVARLRKKHVEPLAKTYRDLLVKRLIPLAVVCAVAIAPVALAARTSVQGDEALIERGTSIFWDGKTSLKEVKLFTVTDLVSPGESGRVVTDHYDVLYQTIYLGFLLPLLALFSIRSGKRHAVFFLLAALLFAVLTLGPDFDSPSGEHLGPQGHLVPGAAPPPPPDNPQMGNPFDRPPGPAHPGPERPGPHPPPLPERDYPSPIYLLLVRIVPFLNSLTVPWELSILAVLFFAVAAAIGLDRIASRWEKNANAIIVIASALVMVEYLLVGPALLPVPSAKVEVPEFHKKMASMREHFAVFDYPMHRPGTGLNPEEYFYFQTVHEKPIAYSVNAGWIDEDPFWSATDRYQRGTDEALDVSSYQAQEAAAFLVANNFRYFIVHKRLIDESHAAPFAELFETMFGLPQFDDASTTVYRIDVEQPAP
jgi:hypothetical protein